jgi:carbonic anhydrase
MGQARSPKGFNSTSVIKCLVCIGASLSLSFLSACASKKKEAKAKAPPAPAIYTASQALDPKLPEDTKTLEVTAHETKAHDTMASVTETHAAETHATDTKATESKLHDKATVKVESPKSTKVEHVDATHDHHATTSKHADAKLRDGTDASHETGGHQAHEAKHLTVAQGVEGSKALGWLQNGNRRFSKGWLRKDGASSTDVKRLSLGQKPHSIILSCSDSRVPPEIIFDQKLGEIFVVRTAGEALDSNAIGSIEYAIQHLGSRLLVVMGHSSCGAVKAAIDTISGGDAGSPSLNNLVADIHPRIRSVVNRGPASVDVVQESWANAKGVSADLLKRSEVIRNAVNDGQVMIKSALYSLKSGQVEFER